MWEYEEVYESDFTHYPAASLQGGHRIAQDPRRGLRNFLRPERLTTHQLLCCSQWKPGSKHLSIVTIKRLLVMTRPSFGVVLRLMPGQAGKARLRVWNRGECEEVCVLGMLLSVQHLPRSMPQALGPVLSITKQGWGWGWLRAKSWSDMREALRSILRNGAELRKSPFVLSWNPRTSALIKAYLLES